MHIGEVQQFENYHFLLITSHLIKIRIKSLDPIRAQKTVIRKKRDGPDSTVSDHWPFILDNERQWNIYFNLEYLDDQHKSKMGSKQTKSSLEYVSKPMIISEFSEYIRLSQRAKSKI